MFLLVVPAAKPANIHRAVIVWMVGLGHKGAANLARLLDDQTTVQSAAEGLVSPYGLGIGFLPPSLRRHPIAGTLRFR